jgi:hypothetical protein
MCINDNAVINNIYGSLEDLILFFKIPMGTRKNFFEIYRPFRHAFPQKFLQFCYRQLLYCLTYSVSSELLYYLKYLVGP